METAIPCCHRCVKAVGCHSTIFGECWSCEAKHPLMFEVMDNDYNSRNNEPITPCEFFEEGPTSGGVIG